MSIAPLVMFALALVFVAVVTKAYKRSYSTLIAVVGFAVSVICFKYCVEWSLWVMGVFVAIMLIRAVVLHRDRDFLFRG